MKKDKTAFLPRFSAEKCKQLLPQIIIFLLLALYAVYVLFPFMIVIVTSFTSDADLLVAKKFNWFPDYSWEGYKLLFETDPFKTDWMPSLLKGFLNTMWQVLIPTVGGLLTSGLAAYSYAKWDFPGKNALFAFTLFLMTINISAGMAGYIFYDWLGWTTGNAAVLPIIIPGLFGAANTVYLLYPVIKGIPDGISESVKVDGGGFFTIFFRFILPLAKPMFMAQFLFSFIGGYNSYAGALVYLVNNRDMWPMQLVLQQITSFISQAGYGNAQCAAAIVSMLPLIILYLFINRYFVEGIMSGSVKG